jgi:hypothetical protein
MGCIFASLIMGCVAFVDHVHGYVRRLTDR